MTKRIIILSFLLSTLTVANQKQDFSFSIGTVNGKAGEYVYDPDTGQKISYLNWEIKNIPVLIGEYRYHYNNFETGIKFKKNFSRTSSGRMKDYDWYSPEDEEAKEEDYGKPFAFSDNKNYVENLFSFDINTKYWFNHNEYLKIGPVLGVKYDYFKFKGKSGDQYDYELNGEYDISRGTGRDSIVYRQKFLTPYLGYAVVYSREKWTTNFEIKGSYYGKAKGQDRHLERGFNETKEKYKNIKSLNLEFQTAYALTSSLDLNAGIEFVKYFKNKKSTSDFISDEGEKENGIKNLAGLKNMTYTISTGITYKF